MITIAKSIEPLHVAAVTTADKIQANGPGESELFIVPKGIDKISISYEGRVASQKTQLQNIEVTKSRIENFSNLANMFNVSESVLADTMAPLNDQERKNFTDAAFKAGDQIGTLISTTKSLDEKERSKFLAFAANLSNKDSEAFLTTITNAPKSMDSIIQTGKRLSQDNLSNFLSSAHMSGREVGLLTKQVNYLLDLKEEDSQKVLTGYLAAAAKTGSMVTNFIKGTRHIASDTTGMIADFVNSKVANTDLTNFISVLQSGDNKAVATIIDISTSLSKQDLGNLLKAASQADKELNGLLRKSSSLSSKGGDDLSNFLTTASKAEGKLGLLLNMSDNLDMSVTAKLSRVDTVNFLTAAKRDDGALGRLTKSADQLSGTDKSNFLYAAATTTTDLAVFLQQVSDQGDEKSAFLSGVVNQHQNDTDPAAYMRGLLEQEDYENFKVAATQVGEEKLDQLVDITNDIRPTDRAGFLKIAAATKETTNEFLNKFQTMTADEQSMYVDLADGLGVDNLKKLAQAVNKTNENYSQFIDLAKELKGNDRSALDFFLSAAADAESTDFKTLVNLVGKLTQKEQHSFLRVASTVGHQLDSLMQMAEKTLPMGQTQFIEIFDSASYASKNLGKFIQSYL